MVMPIFKKDDVVIHRLSHKEGIVIEFNEKYGWVQVKWTNGSVKVYDVNDNHNTSPINLNVDRMLGLEPIKDFK
jgi:hypothetical protein